MCGTEPQFNDGVGDVLFTILLGYAVGTGGGQHGAGEIVRPLVQAALGRLLMGVIMGYIACRAMRVFDDFSVESGSRGKGTRDRPAEAMAGNDEPIRAARWASMANRL
ncbi:hypothetical protein [Bradyrhizobium sp. P5_C11_2]